MEVTFKYMFIITALEVANNVPKLILARGTSCDEDLGMESGLIQDASITSSSYFNPPVGPRYSRIRTTKKGGAWCPKVMVNTKTYEWLQVDLGRIHLVKAIETQGRHANGNGAEYVSTYRIEYKRSEDDHWIIYQDTNGSQTILGNNNTYEAHKHQLEHSIVSRWIRIVPYAQLDQPVCLRLEVYGCLWEEGLVAYNSTIGDSLTPTFDLRDLTYDGDVSDLYTTGGMGILNDGDDGDATLQIKSPGSQRHTGWVGWKSSTSRCSHPPCPLELNLTFDLLRSFQEVTFTCLCTNDGEAGTFDEVRIWLGFELNHLSRHPFTYNASSLKISFPEMQPSTGQLIKEDFFRGSSTPPNINVSQSSSSSQSSPSLSSSQSSPSSSSSQSSPSSSSSSLCRVTIETNGMLARHIRMEVYFSSEWLILSEIRFISTPQDGFFKSKKYSVTSPLVHQTGPMRLPKTFDVRQGGKENARKYDNKTSIKDGKGVINQPGSESSSYDINYDEGVTKSNFSEEIGAITSNQFRSDLPLYVQILVIVVVATLLAVLAIVFAAALFRRKKKRTLKSKCEKEGTNLKSVVGKADDDMIIVEENKIMLQIGKSNGKEFVYFNSKNLQGHVSESTESRHQELNDIPYKAVLKQSAHSTYHLYNPTFFPFDQNSSQKSTSDASLPRIDAKFHSTNRGSLLRHTGSNINSLNNLKAPCNVNVNVMERYTETMPDDVMDDIKILSVDLKEFSSGNFKTIERIGFTDFGYIDLCSLKSESRDLSHETLKKTYPPITSMAVVLHLSSKTNDRNKLKFLQQLKTLLQLRDINILTVTGLCCHSNNTFSVVMETVTWRDMHQFLLESTTEPGRSEIDSCEGGWYNAQSMMRGAELRFLSLGCLTHLGCQVASGMKYLEKCGLVHGDLSARNCLVGPRRLVKICDLARWRTNYKGDYYPLHPWSLPLPVRWMAWEAIHLDEITIKSEVWSFGILLWEIMTLARERPYSNLTDPQVIDNSILQKGGTGLGTAYPLKPFKCPPETYDLMASCWRANPTERPNFQEIFAFLSHKIAGYEPHR